MALLGNSNLLCADATTTFTISSIKRHAACVGMPPRGYASLMVSEQSVPGGDEMHRAPQKVLARLPTCETLQSETHKSYKGFRSICLAVRDQRNGSHDFHHV